MIRLRTSELAELKKVEKTEQPLEAEAYLELNPAMLKQKPPELTILKGMEVQNIH